MHTVLSFIWKARFAFRFARLCRCSFQQAWQVADASWESGYDCTPAEAVEDEIEAMRDSQ